MGRSAALSSFQKQQGTRRFQIRKVDELSQAAPGG